MMTKRDYECIAAAINKRRPQAPVDPDEMTTYATIVSSLHRLLDHTAQDIADHCGSVNPRFDRERFLRACGVSD